MQEKERRDMDMDMDSDREKRETAPAPGERVPDFTLTDTESATWHLDERVAAQRVLLIFYRGQW